MKRQSSFIVVCSTVAALSAAPALGQFGVFVTFPAPLNSMAGTDTGEDRNPQVATDGQGNWVAVWYSDEPDIGAGIGMDIDILMSRSTNNGATWTDPAPLNNNAAGDSGDDSHPQLTTDGLGIWVAVWDSREPDIAGGLDTDLDILVARSTDNGATWTDPAPLNNNAGTDSAGDDSPQVSTDGQGTWVAVWESQEANIGGGIGTDADILVARSTDNGATWTDPAPLNNNAAGDTGSDSSPQVTTDGQGNWVAVWDSDEPDLGGGIGADRDILVARSTDDGATWTDPAVLNSNAAGEAGYDEVPQIVTDGLGNWLTVWESEDPGIAGGIGTEFDILAAQSTDNGETWTDPSPLNSNAAGDTGNDLSSQVTTDGQGIWVAVWYSSEPDIADGIETDADILVARSTDNGKTWTTPAPLNTNAGGDSGGDVDPQVATDGWGNWVVAWGSFDPDIAGGIGNDRDILMARFALPDCNLNEIGDGQDVADGTSEDCNADGMPDECESDIDEDGVIDACDNCVLTSNADQSDVDADGVGNVCDMCPDDPDKSLPGVCGCDTADTDTDSDGIPDCIDATPDGMDSGVCGCGNGLLAMLPITVLGCATMRRRIRKTPR